MNDAAQVCLEMYKAQVSRAQHYETLRTSLTNVVLTLGAALVGLASLDRQLSSTDSWIGGALIVLGIFGGAAGSMHARRSMRHGRRAAAYRDALDAMVPGAGVNRVRNSVVAEETHLNRVWNLLHLVVVACGVILLVLSLTA